jgi:hypothetical protein
MGGRALSHRGTSSGTTLEDLDLSGLDQLLDWLVLLSTVRDLSGLARSEVEGLPARQRKFQRLSSLVDDCLHKMLARVSNPKYESILDRRRGGVHTPSDPWRFEPAGEQEPRDVPPAPVGVAVAMRKAVASSFRQKRGVLTVTFDARGCFLV